MGYELNRLMRQFGVSSPTVAYSGTPIPVAPVAPGASATNEQVTAYNTLVDKYNVAKPQYEADRAAYEPYKQAYQERVMNTPMYAQAQFQRTPAPARPTTVAGLYQSVLGREPEAAGLEGWTREFADPQAYLRANPDVAADPYFGKNPMAHYDQFGRAEGRQLTPVIGQQQRERFVQAARPEMMSSGIPLSGQNIYNLTGSYFGDQLAMPTYGQAGAATAGFTPIERMAVPETVTPAPAGDYGYAQGGAVKTHFQDGGLNDLSDRYEDMPAPAVLADPTMTTAAPPEMQSNVPPVAGRPDLMTLLGKYAPQGNAYGAELAEARKTATAETAAFNAMLQKAISEPGSQGPSKAEMYFRLAAAFGAPTKTGAFSENLAKAGEVLSEQKKAEREASSAERARKLQLGLQAQQAKMAGAKEDLGTLRTLAGEEMKDKRTIAAELLKDYVKSGQPQSSAGKQALDEGLKPGTPEYQKRVSQIGELNVEKQMMHIQTALAGLSAQQANQALAQQKFTFQQEQSTKLTPAELKLKTETEDLVAQTEQAYSNLKRALELNPKTFDTSLVDTAQRKLLEAGGSKDPKVVNTREMENLLEKASLSQLKATFPGAISNDERVALQATQGMAAKSVEERGKIMENASAALRTVYARNKKRLNEINQGFYRSTTMPGENE
jgi:hypothetical protein